MNGSCTTTANSETCESLDSFPQAFHPTNQRIFETQGSEPECPRSNSARHVVRTRLPVVYNPDAPTPTKWIAFLDELLFPEDIPMFQEFVGYLLLPTTLFGVMTTASRRWNHKQFRIFWFSTPPSITSNTPTTYTAWMVVKYGGKGIRLMIDAGVRSRNGLQRTYDKNDPFTWAENISKKLCTYVSSFMCADKSRSSTTDP